MPKEAVEFYTDAAQGHRDRRVETGLYREKSSRKQYMNAADTQAYFEDMIDRSIKTFKEVGYIK